MSLPAHRPGVRRRGWLFAIALSLLPLALLLRDLAFRYPELVESVYGRDLYPRIARLMGSASRLVPFSLAEAALVALAFAGMAYLIAAIRRQLRKGLRGLGGFFLGAVAGLWIAAGMATFSFLLLWGLNYTRPGLEKRMGLLASSIRTEELLALGGRFASTAADLHDSLGQPPDRPTRLPIAFPTLDSAIDGRLRELDLPGDSIGSASSPAKRLFFSPALSYLGLSGIFIPFTGEPCVNSMLPDCALPMVVAHEKAHQRGITSEGEANLVAFLACSRSQQFPYLRYAAYLYGASEVLGAASSKSPREAKLAWESLGAGPRRDLAALKEFWAGYHGRVAEAAERLNDTYLKSFRVPEGVESYDRVVRLLVALERKGQL